MKTIPQIQSDIANLTAHHLKANKRIPPPIYISRGKYAAKLRELDKCLKYIETSPSEDFVKQQLSMVEKEIVVVNAHYEFYNPKEIQFKSELAKRKYYNNLFDLPKLKIQRLTLRYLLDL